MRGVIVGMEWSWSEERREGEEEKGVKKKWTQRENKKKKDK